MTNRHDRLANTEIGSLVQDQHRQIRGRLAYLQQGNI